MTEKIATTKWQPSPAHIDTIIAYLRNEFPGTEVVLVLREDPYFLGRVFNVGQGGKVIHELGVPQKHLADDRIDELLRTHPPAAKMRQVGTARVILGEE